MTTQADTNGWTMGRLVEWTTDHLKQCEIADARLATEVLLANAAGCQRIELYTRFEETPAGDVLDRFRDWVRRAAKGEPIAYLVGEKEFYSLTFAVNSAVLIPRPETEVLVQCVIDHCTAQNLNEPRLLDLGTGSGCISVVLATQLPGAAILATDVSSDALVLAASNADRHNVPDRVRFVEADRLSIPQDAIPPGGFDVIFSNPPYVPLAAVDGLDVNVRDFEPHTALTDGGDGLSFYQNIASDATALLAPTGVVFVEIDDGASASVIEAVEANGLLVHGGTWCDRIVGSERVLMFNRRDNSAAIG